LGREGCTCNTLQIAGPDAQRIKQFNATLVDSIDQPDWSADTLQFSTNALIQCMRPRSGIKTSVTGFTVSKLTWRSTKIHARSALPSPSTRSYVSRVCDFSQIGAGTLRRRGNVWPLDDQRPLSPGCNPRQKQQPRHRQERAQYEIVRPSQELDDRSGCRIYKRARH
jgi:hypothetical protein